MDKEPSVILNDIEATRTALSSKLTLLEGQVRETVEEAKSTVENTIETIKSGVEKTVDNVKQTLDPIHQTQNHPWVMLGGSIITGVALGHWLTYRPSSSYRSKEKNTLFSGYRPGEPAESPEVDNWVHPSLGEARYSPGIWSHLAEEFSDEIKMVKGIALGALVKALAKQATAAFPHLEQDIKRVVDSASRKFGNVSTPMESEPKLRSV